MWRQRRAGCGGHRGRRAGRRYRDGEQRDNGGDLRAGQRRQPHHGLGDLHRAGARDHGPAPGTTVPAQPAGPVNLVFIHHSVGENWLNDGLCQALNESGYHVADIYYGWREYGDHTDTTDWPTWFTDEVMPLVYADLETMTAPNNLDAGPGENTVVMFKSCFPNSDVGSDISDEVALYQSLLPYFGQHLDKMFVLVTPPPMINISDARKTRELCDWLADRSSGWLAGYTGGNVFVFDLYNVLTDPGAHHRLVDGKETHESVKGHNTLYYDSDGDDHPNTRGNVKATEEFVGLLNAWYAAFAAALGRRQRRKLRPAVCAVRRGARPARVQRCRVSTPTHSTCGVCGNISTGVTRSKR